MPTFDFTCEVCGVRGRASRRDKPPRFCSAACRAKGGNQAYKPRKYIITPEMSERIRQTYLSGTGSGEINELARRLGLPRWRVTRYAMNNGFIPKQRRAPRWSAEELAILRREAHRTPEYISRRLSEAGYQRSITSVTLIRKRMRLPANPRGYTATRLARFLGVDTRYVSAAIRRGDLEAGRRETARTAIQGGDVWWITPAAAKAWIVGHVDEIDFRKLDKQWLVDLLTGPAPMRCEKLGEIISIEDCLENQHKARHGSRGEQVHYAFCPNCLMGRQVANRLKNKPGENINAGRA